MEVLLILAVVVGVAVGVGFTTWQLSRPVKSKCTWVVDAAEELFALEKCLNHFSEEGFGIQRTLSASTQAEREHPAFVIVGSSSGVPPAGAKLDLTVGGPRRTSGTCGERTAHDQLRLVQCCQELQLGLRQWRTTHYCVASP